MTSVSRESGSPTGARGLGPVAVTSLWGTQSSTCWKPWTRLSEKRNEVLRSEIVVGNGEYLETRLVAAANECFRRAVLA
jgi:hypothetical protein